MSLWFMAIAVALFFIRKAWVEKCFDLVFYSNRIFRTATNQIFAELLLKCESHLKGSYFYLSQTEIERERGREQERERERELITT